MKLTALDANEMTCLELLFRPFDNALRASYAAACADAAVTADDISLEFANDPYNTTGPRAEFVALGGGGRPSVRVTWAGFASLWCFAQAYSRLAERAVNARRVAGPDCATGSIELEVTAEIEAAKRLFDFALKLRRTEPEEWPTDLPLPNVAATADDDDRGNEYFLSALGWIYRHELAHHVLKHHAIDPLPDESKKQELEADNKATEWLKGDLSADRNRSEGVLPKDQEKELEKRALRIFIGLVWLAHAETISHGRSATHPDAPARIQAIYEQLCLACDSVSMEIFVYFVKFLLDPEGDWEGADTAEDGFISAFIYLSRHINNATTW